MVASEAFAMTMVQGFFKFPEDVPICGDALGAILPVRVGNVDGIVALPRKPEWNGKVQDEMHFRSPEMLGESFRELWGQAFEFPSCDGYLRAAGLRLDVAPADARFLEDGTLHKAVQGWTRRLIDWLSVFTERHVGEEPTSVSPRTTVQLSFDVAKGQRKQVDGGPIVFVTHRREQYVQERSWRRAVEASANELPEERKLLNGARAAMWRGDARHAVLESATAVELALTAALEARLDGRGADFTKYLLRKHRELGRKIELCRALGVELPNGIECLRDNRNLAIHGGQVPKRVWEDVEVARKVLDAHCPIDGLPSDTGTDRV
jgi:hypothetical protein